MEGNTGSGTFNINYRLILHKDVKLSLHILGECSGTEKPTVFISFDLLCGVYDQCVSNSKVVLTVQT